MGANHSFQTRIIHSVDEVGAAEWDALSDGRPFQSARWYRFGERVMADCQPIYIILLQSDLAVARGTFWLVRNEPLPVPSPLRAILRLVLHRRPLLICRSPLSNSSGLILPSSALREAALRQIVEQAWGEAQRLRCSFVLFDFIESEIARIQGWPDHFHTMTVANPGTCMRLEWASFEDYLASKDKKNQRRYKYNIKKAVDLGINVSKHDSVADLEGARQLIQEVEERHRSAHNPWIVGMLANMQMIDSTFLEARLGSQLVGCELLVYDNDAQIPTALGHSESTPYAYFEILYANLQDAFDRGVRLLRWGSGSYDIKRHLGFELEDNNRTIFAGVAPMARWLGWLVAV